MLGERDKWVLMAEALRVVLFAAHAVAFADFQGLLALVPAGAYCLSLLVPRSGDAHPREFMLFHRDGHLLSLRLSIFLPEGRVLPQSWKHK